MSEQALNVRRPVQIVRRHRILVAIVTALGLLMGVAYSVLTPPMLTSTALVVLPEVVQSAASTAARTPAAQPPPLVPIATWRPKS